MNAHRQANDAVSEVRIGTAGDVDNVSGRKPDLNTDLHGLRARIRGKTRVAPGVQRCARSVGCDWLGISAVDPASVLICALICV